MEQGNDKLGNLLNEVVEQAQSEQIVYSLSSYRAIDSRKK